VTRSFVNRLLQLTLLSPDIIETILDGRQSKGLQLNAVTDTAPCHMTMKQPVIALLGLLFAKPRCSPSGKNGSRRHVGPARAGGRDQGGDGPRRLWPVGLLGIYSMTGVAWAVHGETLVLTTNTERYPEPQPSRLAIAEAGADTLTLAGQDYLAGSWRRNDAAAGGLDGTVLYRERKMLPPGATLRVELQDVSRARVYRRS
jgi:hypothetical protein